jgi:hypothetical protein
MAENVTSIAIYLLAGQKIKLESPLSDDNHLGFFVHPGPVVFKGESRVLLRGFLVENEKVGDIAPTNQEEPAIIYTHNRAEDNAIWFFAHTGERGVCNVIAVPIHDHSSIVQGGPAFGTFFSDDSVD